MNISLYGSTGFIGKAFVYHHVNNNNLKNNIKLVPRYSRRPDSDTEMLYLISTTHNYNVFTDPTLDVKTNLGVLTETLESWKNHNPNGTFNFVSSWFVYGNEYPAVGYENQKKTFNEIFGDNYYTYDGGALETDECHPRGFYSITKRCAEQLVISFAETFQMDYRILRLSNVLGKDTEATAQKNALQYLINKMKAGEEIEIYEGGNFFRNYMYVTDTVEAIYQVMSRGQKNSIYNIGNPENYRFIDMIWLAADLLKYDKKKIKFIEQKAFHKKVQAKSFKMNTDRLKRLDFKPVHNMESMILNLVS